MKSQAVSPSHSSCAVTQITARLAKLLKGSDNMPDAATLVELARGVAGYLDEHGTPLDANGRMMMQAAGKALGAIGERHLGQKVLLSSSGLATSSRWSAAGEQPVWVINLEQLCGHDVIELELFRRLDILLARLAELWSETGLPLSLGIRRVHSALAGLTASSRSSADVCRLAQDIRIFTSRRLQKYADDYNWSHCPELLKLDIS
jgi:hypothetical protein